MENRRKIEPKEIPSHLIPRLLVVFTRQLEILVTTLAYIFCKISGSKRVMWVRHLRHCAHFIAVLIYNYCAQLQFIVAVKRKEYIARERVPQAG